MPRARVKEFTPKEYLNIAVINKADYAKDSIYVINYFRHHLKEQKEFFFDNKYSSDSTQITIDTIVYNNEFTKMGILLITQNPTSRLSIKPSALWYYEGTSYIGIRKNNSILLTWMGPSFTKAEDQQELSHDIREYFFTELADKRDSLHKYNMNDTRFWSGPYLIKISP
ncbi:hypothetical protein [Paraflavitalea sp. CAU 1676]|uniref:hypothetical protein n=1 Tax=Paraflavitalea sp. CAU 1676 TaxID=3032598 RepID=UPI0023DC73D6|nr:hypothetical protein [Paraflavitalea sp. CAU 1676]MDF2192811.1 hypothetical protein [Paraflavitalea sp. CAU 1676]